MGRHLGASNSGKQAEGMVTGNHGKFQETAIQRELQCQAERYREGTKETLQPLFLSMLQSPFDSSYWPFQPKAERQESLV